MKQMTRKQRPLKRSFSTEFYLRARQDSRSTNTRFYNFHPYKSFTWFVCWPPNRNSVFEAIKVKALKYFKLQVKLQIEVLYKMIILKTNHPFSLKEFQTTKVPLSNVICWKLALDRFERFWTIPCPFQRFNRRP